MMINKRLIGTVKESKKYIALNVAIQWCSLAANVVMMAAISVLLASMAEKNVTRTGIYTAIIIALIASYILNHTRLGLHLRAVGENPATADAAGINVTRYKYGATCIGCMIAGLGGLYYVMDYACGVWSNDAFGDRGWLAIALAIFAIWRPNLDILASILFGGLYILYLYMPTGMDHMEYKELYKMIPYIVTLAVLVITSMRNKRENQPPASLGLSYFREER